MFQFRLAHLKLTVFPTKVNAMKTQKIIPLILIMLSANALSATISVGNINNIYVADNFLGSSGSSGFIQTFTTTPLNDATLDTIVTSDFSTSVKSPNSVSSIDLAFTQNMFNGAGNDLILFFIGSGTSFHLDVFAQGDSVSSIFSNTYTIATTDAVPTTLANGDPAWLCVSPSSASCAGGYPITGVYVDLGGNIAGDVAIDHLHLTFGNGFNGNNSSNFSLAGGFHNEAFLASVPLPLSSILFSSGLALLGWVSRKKSV